MPPGATRPKAKTKRSLDSAEHMLASSATAEHQEPTATNLPWCPPCSCVSLSNAMQHAAVPHPQLLSISTPFLTLHKPPSVCLDAAPASCSAEPQALTHGPGLGDAHASLTLMRIQGISSCLMPHFKPTPRSRFPPPCFIPRMPAALGCNSPASAALTRAPLAPRLVSMCCTASCCASPAPLDH